MKRKVALLLALLLSVSLVPAAKAETEGVQYRIPGNRPAERLTDGDVMTRITVDTGEQITLTLPHPASGEALYLTWFEQPAETMLIQYDQGGVVIQRDTLTRPEPYSIFPLAEGCTSLSLYAVSSYTVSGMVVSNTPLPASHGFMDKPLQKADMLLILPEPLSGWESLSGLLAAYTVEHQVSTAIVYCCDGRPYEMQEARASLLDLGVCNEPISLHCTDHEFNEINDVYNNWTQKNPAASLAALIDALAPKIVITVGADEANARSVVTNALVREALASAAKTPIKAYEQNSNGQTVLSMTVPLVCFDGKTAQSAAQDAYKLCTSRRMFRHVLTDEVCLSRIDGQAERENDLLSGIHLDMLLTYADPTPTPTPTPEPTATPDPTDTPAAELPTTEAPTVSASEPTPTATLRAERTAAPAANSAEKSGIFSCGGKTIEDTTPTAVPTSPPTPEPTSPPSSTPTPVPTETPTPMQTIRPMPTSTPEPTPTPISAFDAHFINDDSGTEYVSVDTENGEWVYRSDILAVEINRHSRTYRRGSRDYPCVYFVAHIYEREVDSFRSTFGSTHHDGRTVGTAQDMSDRAKCVLWITGDNLINSDPEIKSILIRDGYLYRSATHVDCLVMEPKTLSMRIAPAGSVTAKELLESGVMNSFSFGPTLMMDGSIVERARGQRRTNNPRTMLGMIEPGHFVAVVADGRQPGYSEGMVMDDILELMEELGCEVAYNLDGGMSATMMFLGQKINQHDSAGRDPVTGMSSGQRSMPDGLTWGYSEQMYGLGGRDGVYTSDKTVTK